MPDIVCVRPRTTSSRSTSLLAIFNLIPVPPLDGSALLFRVVARRPPGSCGRCSPSTAASSCSWSSSLVLDAPSAADHQPGHRCAHQPSWWAAKVRQFRSHLRARVEPAERAALRAWLTPAQLALFDGMHVADRRHGLDVVAALRAAGDDRRGRCSLAGLLHDAARAGPASARGSPGRSASATATWVVRLARPCPGSGAALDRLRDHAELSAGARRRGRLLAADGRAHPAPGRRPSSRPPASCSGSPTRRTDAWSSRRRATRAGRSVAFGEGRRPEAATQVRLDGVRGPLGAAAVAHRGAPARRPDGAARGARRGVSRALAGLEADRLGNISAFVAIAGAADPDQEPRAAARDRPSRPLRRSRRGPDPEAELRARLHRLPRLSRCRGARSQAGALDRVGLFRREPSAARRRGPAGAAAGRPPPLDPQLLRRRARACSAVVAAAARPPPEIGAADRSRIAERAELIRAALRGADRDRAPGAAPRRPRPGRRGGHVPGHARADEAARDRRRAGRAVGPDRRPRDDRRGAGGRRRGRSPDEPIDESLESFA